MNLTNPQFDLAFDYVRNTCRNIFLTGKAGTGKTTFLHQLRAENPKRMVVTAPTGVAAINAGGMTLHSFFYLPFGLHVPSTPRQAGETRRFSADKINLLRTLDLLVIDEISMVRADLLDLVDEVLRSYRDDSRPFGGVQLLMIGDLHQLPPVVKAEEWELLRQYYETPYFFGSQALRRTEMVVVELKHVFRQSDARFIELLERVRNNELDPALLETLNSRYRADFQPGPEHDYVTLTSHNASAGQLNSERLSSLPGSARTFDATITGDFPESAYPTEKVLQFKKHAQVMFVRNDPSPEKRYYNGKIGRITRFTAEEIFVRCKGDHEDIPVRCVDWENIKYSLNQESKEISADVLGTFTQYPLKLAWAMTIHKSQGLTFDRVIIDARAAFAHGQVYVALSRCRSFEGVVLSSRINPSSVKTDSVIKAYSQRNARNAPTQADLRQSKAEYQQALLRELFDFGAVARQLRGLRRLFEEHPAALSNETASRFKSVAATMQAEILDIADKFAPQLSRYFSQEELPEENETLKERLRKAAAYFSEKLNITSGEIRHFDLITDDKTVLKRVRQHLEDLKKELRIKQTCFLSCASGFSAAGYNKARTAAALESTPAEGREVESEDIPAGIHHPELYRQLLEWRRLTAKNLGREVHEVVPKSALQEMARLLPRNRASVKQITGIGKTRLKRFGPALIKLVTSYCAEIQPPAEKPQPVAKQARHSNTKLLSYELYRSGKTIGEVAAERHLAVGTIEAHLAYFIARGDLDISAFMTAEQVTEVAGFFREKSTESLAEAKAQFGDKYGYGQLRMVLEYMKARETHGSEAEPDTQLSAES